MKSLDVLMPIEGMGLIGELIGARLPLHRLWLEPNPDVWLAEWAPRIRAIALAGHVRADEAYMRRFPSLEIISSFGVGYDHIDAKAAARLGVIATNTPGVLDDEVADTALGLMLMAVRQLPQAERYLRAGQLAEGRLSAHPFAQGPDGRHRRARAHWQGDRKPGRRLRARRRLPRPQPAGRRRIPLLSLARRDGQSLGHSHCRRPRRPLDAPYRQRRSARGVGAGRGADQYRARLAGRRDGSDRRPEDGQNSGRRTRRLRERAERSRRRSSRCPTRCSCPMSARPRSRPVGRWPNAWSRTSSPGPTASRRSRPCPRRRGVGSGARADRRRRSDRAGDG